MSEGPGYADGLPHGGVRGRGAGLNPGNRFEDVRLHVLGEHLDEVAVENPDGTRVVTRVYRDKTLTAINRVESPDLGFDWTVNPYRGCEHGCIYCYARPGHEYLGMSSGLDFETRIIAKLDAPAILRAELARPGWRGAPIVFSGVTDPYQPVEAKLRITRGCLEACAEFAQPVSLITKNRLIDRDLDVLQELSRHGAASAIVSLTSLDNALAAKMEPRASAPRERLEAIRRLADAGIPVRVMTAPIIPGLNETEVPALLKAAADAGAIGAGWTMVRLPYQIKALFLEWLAREVPEKAARIESVIRQVRGGELSDPRFGARMRGKGERAEHIGRTFRLFRRRCGLDRPWTGLSSAEFERRKAARESGGQLGLFA